VAGPQLYLKLSFKNEGLVGFSPSENSVMGSAVYSTAAARKRKTKSPQVNEHTLLNRRANEQTIWSNKT